jgi:hypothetical protein
VTPEIATDTASLDAERDRIENRDYPGSSHFFFDIGSGNLVYFRDPDGARIALIADPLGEMYGHQVLENAGEGNAGEAHHPCPGSDGAPLGSWSQRRSVRTSSATPSRTVSPRSSSTSSLRTSPPTVS